MGKDKKVTVDFNIDVKVTQPETRIIEYGPHDTIDITLNIPLHAFALTNLDKEVILDNARKELERLLDRFEERT